MTPQQPSQNGAETATAQATSVDVAVLIRYFDEAEDATQDARKQAERDRDYYDGKQWTAAEVAALKRRGQAPIVVNRIRRKIDFLRGVETQQRSDPKAFPRNPQDEDAARAATDALRYVADKCRYAQVRSAVWENLLIEGFGGCEVVVEAKSPPRSTMMGSTAMTPPQPTYEIVIRHLPWDRIGYDPHSRMPDFSDARYVFSVVWMDVDAAKAMYPNGVAALNATMEQGSSRSLSETYDDRPRWSYWVDAQRRRVRIVKMWHKDGGGRWACTTFTMSGELEHIPSPYQDEDGQPCHDMVLQSAYVDRDNNRYGAVRELISLQDEINHRRSKALHLLSVRQTFGNARAIQDVDAARRQLARPDGHVNIVDGEFGRDFGVLPTGDMAAGQFQLLQHATAEFEVAGPNAAMSGKGGDGQSGRAILAQQQGGYIELGPLTDRLRDFDLRVYRAVWNRVRQFWTDERWVRVTDDERTVRFVGLNRPVTAGEAFARQLEQQGIPPEQIQAEMQAMANDPRLSQVIGQENVPAEMDMDIIIEAAPDTVTAQQEAYADLLDLARSGTVQIPPEVIIEASPFRNKGKLLEMLRKPQEDPQAQQMQAMGQELQLRGAAAQVRATEAKAAKDEADAAAKVAEIQRGPEAPQAPSTLDQAQKVADIRHKDAQTAKIEADTVARMIEATQPMPVVWQAG